MLMLVVVIGQTRSRDRSWKLLQEKFKFKTRNFLWRFYLKKIRRKKMDNKVPSTTTKEALNTPTMKPSPNPKSKIGLSKKPSRNSDPSADPNQPDCFTKTTASTTNKYFQQTKSTSNVHLQWPNNSTSKSSTTRTTLSKCHRTRSNPFPSTSTNVSYYEGHFTKWYIFFVHFKGLHVISSFQFYIRNPTVQVLDLYMITFAKMNRVENY